MWKKWREKGRKKQNPFFINLLGTVKYFESKIKLYNYKISNFIYLLNSVAKILKLKLTPKIF